jgi:uncharacterized phage protein (TIGR01671 family)
MNRPIKFRAWDKEEKVMLDMPPLDTASLFSIGYLSKRPVSFEIMQFTGLTDKNGKEIYEGDVVKSSQTDNLFDVLWVEDSAAFKILERKNGKKWMFGYDARQKFEVVGNIYEV